MHHFGEPNYYKYKVLEDFKKPMVLRDGAYQTSHKIQKGDLLIHTKYQELEVFYVSEKIKGTVFAPSFSYVLHSKNEKYPQEFLYLYLNSELFKRYIRKFFKGNSFPMIPIDAIKNFPIIDLSYAPEYYKKLCKCSN